MAESGLSLNRGKEALSSLPCPSKKWGLRMRSTRPILLVEDDHVDTMTVKRSFKDLNVINPLATVSNGEEALEYLRDENNERPCVILLDLNMPRMNGIELLKILKADDELKMIPVVVLTTSEDIRDKIAAFGLSAAGYIVKPTDYKKFVEAMKIIDIYWTLSELPVEVNA
jgi:CheY-like chemotaxis protein